MVKKRQTKNSSKASKAKKSAKITRAKATPASKTKSWLYRKASTPTKKKKKAAPQTRFQRFRKWLFSGIVMAQLASIMLTLLLIFCVIMTYFAYDMPDISQLDAPRTSHGIQVKDAKGKIIARYGDIYGDHLTFDKIPNHVIGAVLATEDRNFFKHYGLDPTGIARAMVVNVKKGKFSQGGSTITQQLAKNIFLSSERTLKRKIQEMMLAFWLESKFSKEKILSIYLNKVYLGAGNYGIDAASRYYFHKPAVKMTLAESAVIAGLLKAPSRYAPTSSIERSKGRAHQVLLNMVDAGRLTQKEADTAIKTLHFPIEDKVKLANIKPKENDDKKAKIIDPTVEDTHRYFADWIVDQVPEYLGDLQEDIIIETTLNPKMQKLAEKALTRSMAPKIQEKNNAHQAALVSMRANGEVVALVGGLNYNKNQYNRATQAKRQPGSVFKPIVYMTALEMGYTPDSQFEDKPIYIRGWSPKNHNKKNRGWMSMDKALTYSVNTIAVQLQRLATTKKVINTAKRLGIKSKMRSIASLSLGSSEVTPLEMTTVFAHFSSNGNAVKPFGIKKITSRITGKTLYKYKKPSKTKVLAEDEVAKMNSMLSNVISNGTGKVANISRPSAGKTGTTSDYKDAWFIGYTGNLTTGVWVGNDNAKPMKKVSGGSIPARIWRNYMHPADRLYKVATLPKSYESKVADLPWTQQVNNHGATATKVALGGTFWSKLMSNRDKGEKKIISKKDLKNSKTKKQAKSKDKIKDIYKKKNKALKKRPVAPKSSNSSKNSERTISPAEKARRRGRIRR